jgi:hypothetical protein
MQPEVLHWLAVRLPLMRDTIGCVGHPLLFNLRESAKSVD